jgi:hypothetical protein
MVMTNKTTKENIMSKNNIIKINQYEYLIDKVKIGVKVIFKQNNKLKELNIIDYKKLTTNN